MAGLLGSVGPFERDTDDWTAYCERLQQYFVANEIKVGEQFERSL